MTYSDIIRDNVANHSPIPWWPRFAYHNTDITNAVSILDSGKLYSRIDAEEFGIMENDNASRKVINMTQTEATSCVRFYFRPLTPTQYYNEGYKHPKLRYHADENANMPVPVFFVFDLEKLLSLPGVKFSEKKRSGYGGAPLKSGIEEFSELDFDKIYDNSFDNFSITKDYRHAEIQHPTAMEIDNCLTKILCRNNIEKVSLMTLLSERNRLSFEKYKNIIAICKEDMFENNGLFIKDCRYYNETLVITFSDTFAKRKYIERMKKNNQVNIPLEPVSLRIELDWYNSRTHIHHILAEGNMKYDGKPTVVLEQLPTFPNATHLKMQIYIDDKLMCYINHILMGSEIIK